jgi:hypothetical protein
MRERSQPPRPIQALLRSQTATGLTNVLLDTHREKQTLIAVSYRTDRGAGILTVMRVILRPGCSRGRVDRSSSPEDRAPNVALAAPPSHVDARPGAFRPAHHSRKCAGREGEMCDCENRCRPNGAGAKLRGQGLRAEADAARRLPACESRDAGGVTPRKLR